MKLSLAQASVLPEIAVPEPEAFALHKLIVCGLRKDTDKATKDLEAAIGLLQFFAGKPARLTRLHDIYCQFPKRWRAKLVTAMKNAGINKHEYLPNFGDV